MFKGLAISLRVYTEDVRARRFQEAQHTYNMIKGEFAKLMADSKK
jgi:hypothetical protein